MAERTRNESSSFDASKREIQEIQEILLQKSISLLDRLGFSYSLSEREFRIDYGMPTLALEMPLMISAAFGPEISTVETSLKFPSELKSGSPKEKETDAWPAVLDHPADAKIRRPELEICQRERQLELCRFLMEVSSHSFPGFFRADFENQRLICQFSWMSRATDTDLKSLLTILFSGLREIETIWPACRRILEGKSSWHEALSLYPLWYASLLLDKRDLLASQGNEARQKSIENELESLRRRIEEDRAASFQSSLLNETLSEYIPGSR